MSTHLIGDLYTRNPDINLLHDFVKRFFDKRHAWSYIPYHIYYALVNSEKKYRIVKIERQRNYLLEDDVYPLS